jgi:hypothetical protein
LALAVAAALVVVAAAPPARAKGSLQGTAEVGVGWTDNVFNAPYEVPGQPPACDPNLAPANLPCAANAPLPRYADFFFELRPGVIFTTGAARAVQQLSFNFSSDLYTQHPQGDTYSNTLTWAGFFLPSRKTELLVLLQSQQGRANTLTLPAGMFGVTQGGSTTYFNQTASDTLLWHVTDKWNFIQALTFVAFIPIDPRTLSDTYTTTLDIGGERLFAIDAVGLDFRSQHVLYVEQRDPITNVQPPNPYQNQIINTLIARWRRDWTRLWSTELGLGAVEGNAIAPPAGTNTPVIWQPYALGALRYFRERGNGELRYEHNLIPNPLTGTTFAIDAVTLRALIPFPERSRMALSLTVGYEHGELTDPTRNGATGTTDALQANANLGFQATSWLGVFARYEAYRQWGHPEESNPLPSILRQVVLVGVNGVYPTSAAARVPRTPGLRVDRADTPLIPEPHSAPVPK